MKSYFMDMQKSFDSRLVASQSDLVTQMKDENKSIQVLKEQAE